MTPSWLDWAQRLQAIAQNGLAFTTNEFDKLRYHDVREIAAEMLSQHTGQPLQAFHDLWAGEKGYATPKVDVRGVVFQNDRVPLVKERSDGLWTLPGGYADVGISARETVVKEVREESGYEVAVKRLLAVHDRNKHEHPPFMYHVYKIFIECELIGGVATTSVETDGVDFFEENDLPPLSLSRVNAIQIRRWFEFRRHPEWTPDFD